MPVFQYTGFNRAGGKVSGTIDAPSVGAASAKLRQQQLFIKELRSDTAKRDREVFPLLAKLLSGVSRKQIGLFANQLGTLLGAGIALDTALSDIQDQTENQNLRKIIAEMREAITEGKTLSESFGMHRDVFPPVYENMIRVGEATGSYERTLMRLAELEEKNEELKSKAITALIYPVIMGIVSIAVVFFLLTTVVPQIETMFASLKGELPLPTRIILFFSTMVRSYSWLMFLIAGGAAYAFYRYRNTQEGRMATDSLALRLPFFGSLNRKITVGRFARNLGVLFESHVPLLTAMEIVSASVSNVVFRKELEAAQVALREGSSLREALQSSSVLPHMAKGMLTAGEATDRMGEMLIKIAEIMENEVDAGVKRLTNALEPVMIVFMGLVVTGIMASVMMPLYKMTELMK